MIGTTGRRNILWYWFIFVDPRRDHDFCTVSRFGSWIYFFSTYYLKSMVTVDNLNRENILGESNDIQMIQSYTSAEYAGSSWILFGSCWILITFLMNQVSWEHNFDDPSVSAGLRILVLNPCLVSRYHPSFEKTTTVYPRFKRISS